MRFVNDDTGETFEEEDDYLRSLKQNDSYSFSYGYEYIADRSGDGDGDTVWETATVDVSLDWDDSSAPGYVISCTIHSPTPLPNEWGGGEDEVLDGLITAIADDATANGVSPEVFKDWP